MTDQPFPRRMRGVTTIEIATVALLLAVAAAIALPVALQQRAAGERGAARVSLLAVETALSDLGPAFWNNPTAGEIAAVLNDAGVAATAASVSQGPDDPSVSAYDTINNRVLTSAAVGDSECMVTRFTPASNAAGTVRRPPAQTATTWATFAFEPEAGGTCDASDLPAGVNADDIVGSKDTPSDLTP